MLFLIQHWILCMFFVFWFVFKLCVVSVDNNNMANDGDNSEVQHSGGIKYPYEYDDKNYSMVKEDGSDGKFLTTIYRTNEKKYKISIWVHRPNLNVLRTFCTQQFPFQSVGWCYAAMSIITNFVDLPSQDTYDSYTSEYLEAPESNGSDALYWWAESGNAAGKHCLEITGLSQTKAKVKAAQWAKGDFSDGKIGDSKNNSKGKKKSRRSEKDDSEYDPDQDNGYESDKSYKSNHRGSRKQDRKKNKHKNKHKNKSSTHKSKRKNKKRHRSGKKHGKSRSSSPKSSSGSGDCQIIDNPTLNIESRKKKQNLSMLFFFVVVFFSLLFFFLVVFFCAVLCLCIVFFCFMMEQSLCFFLFLF